MRLTPIFVFISFFTAAQDINVEYDKNRDLSRYKTFRMGGGEVITPKDQQQGGDSEKLKKMVVSAIENELKGKGLHEVDSLGDLIVSYVVGSDKRSDLEQLGPGGMMPGNSSQTWSRDYRMGSLIIDLNDRSNNLIWRVNATTSDSNDASHMVDQVVAAGFKKFSLKPKKVKKKK